LTGHENFPRINPNRDARTIYNALNNPGYIIWLAAAAGIEPARIQQAIEKSRPAITVGKKAAAARKVLPWELVAAQLDTLSESDKQQRHFIAYHNKDKRGRYGPYKGNGTFLTNKNFRAETLQGERLWVSKEAACPRSIGWQVTGP
jgi:hypothetical protein